MNKLAAFFISLLLITQAYAADIQHNNLIVPGKRVGFITKDMTEEKLHKILSPGQIKRVLHDEGEGTYICATEVFPDTEKSLIITWKNKVFEWPKNDSSMEEQCRAFPTFHYVVEAVIIEKPYWRTKEGAAVGVNLVELEKANAAPLIFAFGPFCGSGNITSWNKGKLSGNRYKDYDDYSVIAGHVYADYSYYPSDADALEDKNKVELISYNTEKHEGIISSDLPVFIKKQITLQGLTIYLEKDAPIPTGD